MLYRELGKTGRQVSVIGLGCENLDGKPYTQVNETITAALEHGWRANYRKYGRSSKAIR